MPKPLTTNRLAGTQAEMGAQHGRLTADDAARLFEFYRSMPERVLAGDLRGPGAGLGRWFARQLATAWQARLVRDRAPEDAARTAAFIAATGTSIAPLTGHAAIVYASVAATAGYSSRYSARNAAAFDVSAVVSGMMTGAIVIIISRRCRSSEAEYVPGVNRRLAFRLPMWAMMGRSPLTSLYFCKRVMAAESKITTSRSFSWV